MEYTGKLFGKVGRTYFPLIQTAADVDAMKRERDAIEEKLSQTCEPLHEFVAESDIADGTEAGHSVAVVAVQYGRRYRRERDEWKANHDNQVELKRIIVARPDLAERAPMVEKLMHERNQAQVLNIAFHMRIRKLESIIRQMDSTSAILPENAIEHPTKGAK